MERPPQSSTVGDLPRHFYFTEEMKMRCPECGHEMEVMTEKYAPKVYVLLGYRCIACKATLHVSLGSRKQ